MDVTNTLVIHSYIGPRCGSRCWTLRVLVYMIVASFPLLRVEKGVTSEIEDEAVGKGRRQKREGIGCH